jgi:hypothetical protein
MAKFLVPFLLAASTAFAAAAGGVAGLNAEIVKVLTPFQNQTTEARLTFNQIETNAERALALSLSGLYRKVGPNNSFALEVQNLSYEYGDGTAPTTSAQASVKADFTKFVPQEQLNEVLDGIEQLITQMSSQYTSQYGDAITVKAEVTDRVKDSAGNYMGVKGNIRFSFDFSKLPQGMTAADVLLMSGSAEIAADVHNGLTLNARVVSNPSYKGFQSDGAGLKEILDQLLNHDPDTMNQLKHLFEQLDQVGGQIVGQ